MATALRAAAAAVAAAAGASAVAEASAAAVAAAAGASAAAEASAAAAGSAAATRASTAAAAAGVAICPLSAENANQFSRIASQKEKAALLREPRSEISRLRFFLLPGKKMRKSLHGLKKESLNLSGSGF